MHKFLIPLILLLTSCQNSNLPTPLAKESVGFRPVPEAKTDLLQASKPPEWSHFCSFETKDAFGDKSYIPQCTLSVVNVGSLIGLSYPMFMEPVITVSSAGVTVVKPERKSTCQGRSPFRMAVDQQRIDALPIDRQLQALRTGYLFTREAQANWPYCGIAPHATYLFGFGAAYDSMMQEWNKGVHR